MHGKAKKLTRTIAHVESAIAILNKIQRKSTTDDAGHYAYELSKLLSADRGEAGITALLSLYQREEGVYDVQRKKYR